MCRMSLLAGVWPLFAVVSEGSSSNRSDGSIWFDESGNTGGLAILLCWSWMLAQVEDVEDCSGRIGVCGCELGGWRILLLV